MALCCGLEAKVGANEGAARQCEAAVVAELLGLVAHGLRRTTA